VDFTLSTKQFTYAGNDPVNGSDPTGLYAYKYYWTLGALGSPTTVFNYMITHLNTVFPFSTGGCKVAQLGENCDFHPTPGSDDHLFVYKLGPTSFTLKVKNWCQVGILGICLAGDPPGSTIRFAISSDPASLFGLQTCSGQEDVLSQQANSPGAGPITNLFAPSQAALAWHQQAINLSTSLGGTASDVNLIEGPGWSSDPLAPL